MAAEVIWTIPYELHRLMGHLDPRKIGKRIHGAEVIAADDVTRLRGRLILVAVGALSRQRDLADDPWLSARSEIREQLECRRSASCCEGLSISREVP